MNGTQLSLFGAPTTTPAARTLPLPRHAEPSRAAPPAAPAREPPADPFPVPDAWQHKLSRAGYPEPIVVVSALYTEQILEALAGADGQLMLWRDGRITQAAPADWPPRRRFLTPEEARALHATHPLVVIGWPLEQTLHLRLARPGDAVLPELPLPPFAKH